MLSLSPWFGPSVMSSDPACSQSIALAKKHAQELGYEPRMDPEFAADLEEIVRNRKPWNPPAWE